MRVQVGDGRRGVDRVRVERLCAFAERQHRGSTPMLIGGDREILGGPGGRDFPLGRGAGGAGSKRLTSKVQRSTRLERWDQCCVTRTVVFICLPVSTSRALMVRMPSMFTSKVISRRAFPAEAGRRPLKRKSP